MRVIERGGDVLVHLLGRGDPWAARRSCSDNKCQLCQSRSWLHEQQKKAKKDGTDLPECLMRSSSHQCRREGVTYSLQCLPCALVGVKAVYWGESSRLARQHLGEHHHDAEQGLVKAPMVQHSVEAHGGTRPHYVALIHKIEVRPLYRAMREAVMIGGMPPGLSNINRCQEWGNPRVPVLVASGAGGLGDDQEQQQEPQPNPRPLWSMNTMGQIKSGSTKRIQYWDGDTSSKSQSQPESAPNPEDPLHHHSDRRSRRSSQPRKKPRMDLDPCMSNGPTPEAGLAGAGGSLGNESQDGSKGGDRLPDTEDRRSRQDLQLESKETDPPRLRASSMDPTNEERRDGPCDPGISRTLSETVDQNLETERSKEDPGTSESPVPVEVDADPGADEGPSPLSPLSVDPVGSTRHRNLKQRNEVLKGENDGRKDLPWTQDWGSASSSVDPTPRSTEVADERTQGDQRALRVTPVAARTHENQGDHQGGQRSTAPRKACNLRVH